MSFYLYFTYSYLRLRFCFVTSFTFCLVHPLIQSTVVSKANVCKCPSVVLKWSLRAVASLQTVVIDYILTTDNT